MASNRDMLGLVCDDLKQCFFDSMSAHTEKEDTINVGLFYMILGTFCAESLISLYELQGLSKEQMDKITLEFCELLKNATIKFSENTKVLQ